MTKRVVVLINMHFQCCISPFERYTHHFSNDLLPVLFLPFFCLLRDEIIKLKPDLVLFISDHRYDKYLQLILPLDSGELTSSPVMGYEINEMARLTFTDIKALDFPEFDCYRLHCTDYCEADRLTEMVRTLPT